MMMDEMARVISECSKMTQNIENEIKIELDPVETKTELPDETIQGEFYFKVKINYFPRISR